ncbi:MAG: 1A family penicillin-binding protein [Candidatus Gottesmanbacteria bacterium GW2011_GWA2_43_14]|uniref:1A family penicillin-binding protein n=1 Tax=Candidatus Gottesmanbacteria bacterium GW2011_GWA2_43_14 TaxID=1618443 RepID=A0A0G1DL61_9BACT|nr:MAG: 1A family penicillin-binding protein [Candidatus Gottesmanbacteria bacterium GW2011_GWA2_43_14]
MSYAYNRRFRRIRLPQASRRQQSRFSYKLRLLRVRLLNFILAYLWYIVGGTVVFLLLLFAVYSRDLPSPEKIQRREGFSTVILDRNGKTVYDIYTDRNTIPVKFDQIPDHLKKATIAIEDKDFYKHQGFSTRGMLRAVINILTLKGLQGGSTLTQQLVKNVLLTSERTLPRKFKEFILAVEIERKYSKDEILQMYLNEAPYGGTMWGIESAAQGYFGKTTKELDLLESVILAGLPQRPSFYSPFNGSKDAYKERSEEVLRRMREDNYITTKQENDYKKSLNDYKFKQGDLSFRAPHFVEYVKKQLIAKFGEKKVEQGGLKVVTTLDLDLQKKAEDIVFEEVEKVKNLKVGNGAAVVIDPASGEILAYVGSKQYDSDDEKFQGKYDVVSLGLRQPGSALKPITYAVSFSKNYTPASLIMDVETKFPGGTDKPDYIPKNYDGKFRGPVQLRFALGNSINVPAVKLTALVGIREILETAYNMGLTTLEPTRDNENRLGLSITLGGGEVRLLELTSAYGVFATGGIKYEPVSILKVSDTNDKTLFEHKKMSGKRVLGEDVSFLVSHILLDNVARRDVFGERSYLVIPGKTVSVKTGTTDDKKDNWAVGYTPYAVAGVWVGNNDNSPMDPRLASGATGASPIWNRLMKEITAEHKDQSFPIPGNVVSLVIDAYGGGLPRDGRPTRSEYFIKGTEPTQSAPIYQKLKISKNDSNKLANLVEIATGQYEEKDFIVFEENDPAGSDPNRWQEGIDKWLETQSDPSYKYPKEKSTSNQDQVVVNIKKPSDKARIDINSVEIEAEGRAVARIERMEIYVDGNLREKNDGNSIGKTIQMDNGIRKIKVKVYVEGGKTGEAEITVGINTDPNYLSPTPTVGQILTVTSAP